MRIIVALLISTFSTFGWTADPYLNLYTDNVENRFEVGSKIKIFAEIRSDNNFLDENTEIVLEGNIVGFPNIDLQLNQLDSDLFMFESRDLVTADVGERYFQAQMKIRPKREANKLKKAILANENSILENTEDMNASTDPYEIAAFQREINRLLFLNEVLQKELDSLSVSLGDRKELGLRVVSRGGDSVSVVISETTLTLANGSSGSYNIKLSERPTSDVFVKVKASSMDIELNGTQFQQLELLFTPDNYHLPQNINVKLSENSSQSGEVEIEHTAWSKDFRFNELPIPSINVYFTTDSVLPEVNFLGADMSASEGDIVELKIVLSHASTNTVSVPFVVCGTAEYSIDHDLMDGEFIFLPGEVEKTVLISIIADEDEQELDEDIVIELMEPQMATLGQNKERTITILGQINLFTKF